MTAEFESDQKVCKECNVIKIYRILREHVPNNVAGMLDISSFGTSSNEIHQIFDIRNILIFPKIVFFFLRNEKYIFFGKISNKFWKKTVFFQNLFDIFPKNIFFHFEEKSFFFGKISIFQRIRNVVSSRS